jgi:hypothetical protein
MAISMDILGMRERKREAANDAGRRAAMEFRRNYLILGRRADGWHGFWSVFEVSLQGLRA